MESRYIKLKKDLENLQQCFQQRMPSHYDIYTIGYLWYQNPHLYQDISLLLQEFSYLNQAIEDANFKQQQKFMIVSEALSQQNKKSILGITYSIFDTECNMPKITYQQTIHQQIKDSNKQYPDYPLTQEDFFIVGYIQCKKQQTNINYIFKDIYNINKTISQNIINREEKIKIISEYLETNSKTIQQILQDYQQNEIQCDICFDNLKINSLESIQSTNKCKHLYHKKCFKEYLEDQIISKQIPIKCPAYHICKFNVHENNFKNILDQHLIQKYHQFDVNNVIEQNIDLFVQCPGINCDYAVFKEPGVTTLACEKCRKLYCITCKSKDHRGKTCIEYLNDKINNTHTENDQKFLDELKKNNIARCPKCKYYIERNGGCKYITCRCQQEFCFLCGSLATSYHKTGCYCPKFS